MPIPLNYEHIEVNKLEYKPLIMLGFGKQEEVMKMTFNLIMNYLDWTENPTKKLPKRKIKRKVKKNNKTKEDLSCIKQNNKYLEGIKLIFWKFLR